ncbi:MAG TPA: chromosomal replication initiator protein DnaA [Gemmataceae bacterium]|nr:chromosomal replication initiator protein DnaA [Gemmataceae bacterium]
MTTSDREVVAALEQAIVQRIGEPRFNLWFARRTKFVWDDGQLTVGVPNLHFQEWLQKTFADAIRAAAADVFGASLPVRFVIDPELFQAARQEQEEERRAGGVSPPVADRPDLPSSPGGLRPPLADAPAAPRKGKKPAEGPTLFDGLVAESIPQKVEPRAKPARRWHKLSEFVVGPCNRVAVASALSVVEEPGQTANPLVLHGPVGTGKTHLLEGIYAGLRRARAETRVLYVTAEDFTNRFVQAMRTGKLAAFRRHFRECDALLVDDLHFLAGKKATQEEFLHTFDALLADGRQVVVTCDCHPRLADEFPPELADRLLGGAVWGLTPPDEETRLAILRVKAAAGPALIADEVLRLLAVRLHGNVRELEGALHSLRHYGRVTGGAIDLPLAHEALADLLRHAVRGVRLSDVDAAVCRALTLDGGALQSKGRAWAVSHPRMLAMFLARKHTAAAYSEVGAYFGGRNHSTAVAAEKKVRRWIADDGELVLGERRLRVREVVERVERELLR